MALIKLGAIVGLISGKIGSTVFSRNGGGTYAKNLAIPVDPNTTAQQNVRAILSSQSQAWQALTDAQRASWENWAVQNLVTNRLGDQIQLSGHQAFVQINSRLDLDAQTTLTAPPISAPPLALDSISQAGDIGAGSVALTFAATPLAAGVELWLESAVVNSAGISYVRNLFKFTGTSAAAEVTPYDNQADIEAVFGTLIVGQRLFTRARTFDTATGLISVALESSVTIITT